MDSGANRGVAGSDTRIISQTGRTVVITGIDNHQLDNILVGTCGAVVPTNKGEVIAILHEYALFGKGQTIHSSGQINHFKNFVHDKSMKVGGLQCIITNGKLAFCPADNTEYIYVGNDRNEHGDQSIVVNMVKQYRNVSKSITMGLETTTKSKQSLHGEHNIFEYGYIR